MLGNQFRSHRRRSRLDAELCELGVAAPVDTGVVVLQDLSDRRVVAAIRQLKPVDREIVMLSAWEELLRSVIAEMMGMTKAAVDKRIQRSYERLAQVLGVAPSSDSASETNGWAQA